jgi:hypothetical protein
MNVMSILRSWLRWSASPGRKGRLSVTFDQAVLGRLKAMHAPAREL